MTNRSIPAGKARGLVLAIETSGRTCSVAVLAGGTRRARESVATDHGHATLLIPMIERVRLAAGCDFVALDRIAVAVGPGSFTGIRVGLAAALGLSLASGVPAVGISSFQVMGAGAFDGPEDAEARRFVLLDSRREEPFLAELDAALDFVGTPSLVSVADFDALLVSAGPSVVVGDAPALTRGPAAFPGAVRVVSRSPDAAMVAVLAADPARRYDLPPKPIYLRAPDVTLQKPA